MKKLLIDLCLLAINLFAGIVGFHVTPVPAGICLFVSGLILAVILNRWRAARGWTPEPYDLPDEKGSHAAWMVPILSVLIFLTGCSQMSPTAARPLVAAATSATIQYAVPKAQRVDVARNTVAAGNLYTLYSGGAVPSPAQFQLALDNYLPNNPAKALSEAGLVSLYSIYYPHFAGKVPQVQLDWLTNILLGAKDGAAPLIAP